MYVREKKSRTKIDRFLWLFYTQLVIDCGCESQKLLIFKMSPHTVNKHFCPFSPQCIDATSIMGLLMSLDHSVFMYVCMFTFSLSFWS